jgi:hypothetical protein
MDVKRKIAIQGILIGVATTGGLMYVDKFVFSSSLASLFAGDWEILVWVVIFLFSMGTGVQSLQKTAITNAQIDEIDKKK